MAIIINGQSYNGKKGIKTGNEFYSKVKLAATVTGTPTVGTDFSALNITVRCELPDLGITGAAAAAVTGFSRSTGTVAAGSNSVTITWQGLTAVAQFTVSGSGAAVDGLPATLTVVAGASATLTATLAAGSDASAIIWSVVSGGVTLGDSGLTQVVGGQSVKVNGVSEGAAVVRAIIGQTAYTCNVTVTASGGGTTTGELDGTGYGIGGANTEATGADMTNADGSRNDILGYILCDGISSIDGFSKMTITHDNAAGAGGLQFGGGVFNKSGDEWVMETGSGYYFNSTNPAATNPASEGKAYISVIEGHVMIRAYVKINIAGTDYYFRRVMNVSGGYVSKFKITFE